MELCRRVRLANQKRLSLRVKSTAATISLFVGHRTGSSQFHAFHALSLFSLSVCTISPSIRWRSKRLILPRANSGCRVWMNTCYCSRRHSQTVVSESPGRQGYGSNRYQSVLLFPDMIPVRIRLLMWVKVRPSRLLPLLWMYSDGPGLVQSFRDYHWAVRTAETGDFYQVNAVVRPVQISCVETQSVPCYTWGSVDNQRNTIDNSVNTQT